MVSTKILIIAVVVPVTVLVLVIALICWLGLRRHWFAKREQKTVCPNSGSSQDKSSVTVREGSFKHTGIENHGQPVRVAAPYKVTPPHLLASTEVHQLHGDEMRGRLSA
jgi:hypothetical protein